MVLKECEDLATFDNCLDEVTVKDGLRRLDLFEGDEQRAQVRLSNADNIINAESAKLSRKSPGPWKRM